MRAADRGARKLAARSREKRTGELAEASSPVCFHDRSYFFFAAFFAGFFFAAFFAAFFLAAIVLSPDKEGLSLAIPR